MKNINKFSKIFLFITTLSGALWLGSYTARLFLVYQLFEPTLELKAYVTEQNLAGILTTVTPAIVTTFALYIIFITSYIVFISTSRLSLKKNGWLFVISIIILLTMPFEFFLMTIDYKIFNAVNSGVFDVDAVLDLLKRRMNLFSSFPVVEIFCYFAIVFFVVFKPLKAKELKENEN